MIDSNLVVRAYLAAQASLTTMVGTRISCPKLESDTLPAIAFFTRGGTSSPYIPEMPNPSKQFKCYGSTPIIARQVYRALYDSLEGIQNVKVTISGTDYYILSAIEEVQGQDLQDPDIPGRFYVLTFFSILVR